MDSATISRIEKGKQYAAQRDQRISFEQFTVHVKGNNADHTVTFHDNMWHCTCESFQLRGVCSHTQALEIVLEGVIPSPAKTEPEF